MRNALLIDENTIVTTDNSGGIGEKSGDVVSVPDRLTAYYAARVALLEQWAACAEPSAILIHNFSGPSSWDQYVQGVMDLFREAGEVCPPISGSTETNMELVQSAVAVTIIGKRRKAAAAEAGKWFTYGIPLVGEEVLLREEEVASMGKIKRALKKEVIQRIWPVGSQGILQEARRMMNDENLYVETALDIHKTAGPSTVVLVEVPLNKIQDAKTLFGISLQEIHFK